MKLQIWEIKSSQDNNIMYDIDKAYVMGLCFDNNGKYLGWSNLFDYSNEKTLEASEKLPMPKGVQYNRVSNKEQSLQNYTQRISSLTGEWKSRYEKRRDSLNDIVNIDDYITKIEAVQNDSAKKIELEAELLNVLYKHIYNDGVQDWVNIEYTNPRGQDVIFDLNKHERTIIPAKNSADVSKNFISSHIQYTVQDLVNMTRAYSPIEMEVFKNASKYSDKGNESAQLTLLNPACKMTMQYQNMVGKNVIGIAANGEKGSFMWHYYLNDIIRHGTDEQIKKAQFNFTTNRVVGRAAFKDGTGDIVVHHTVTGLPDMNFETLAPERKQKMEEMFNQRITGNLYVDLMISQVLSAATDFIRS